MTTRSDRFVTVASVNKSQAITVISFPFKINPHTYQQLSQDNGYNFGDLADTAFAYAVMESVKDRLHKDLRSRDQFQVLDVCGGVAANGNFNLVITGAPSKSKVEGSIKAATLALVPKSGTVRDLCKKMRGSDDTVIKSVTGAYESAAHKFMNAIGKCSIFIIGKLVYKDSNVGGKVVTGASKLAKFVDSLSDKFDSIHDKLSRISNESAPTFPTVSFQPREFFHSEMSIGSAGALAFVAIDYYSKQNIQVILSGNSIYFNHKPSGQDSASYARYADGAMAKFKGSVGAGIAYYAATMCYFSASELKSLVSSNITKSDIVSVLGKSIKSI
jgi:hypothetical protein